VILLAEGEAAPKQFTDCQMTDLLHGVISDEKRTVVTIIISRILVQ
jgi:hypothetical protein